MKKEETPRHRRLDLINSLETGDQKMIANLLKCTSGHVSMVLNGKRSQTNILGINIMRLAERCSQQAHTKMKSKRSSNR